MLTLRVGLGLWFLWVGADKAFRVGPVAFSAQVEDFRIFVDPWNLALAYLVPWVEIVGGIGLLTGWGLRGAVRLLGALTITFVFVNGQAWARGLAADCGCFGKLITLGHPAKMALVLVQLALLGVVMATEKRGRRVFQAEKMKLPG